MNLDRALSLKSAPEFFNKRAPQLAPLLLGKLLLRPYRGDWIGGMICETEAYSQEDPACHCYRGLNAKNKSMFGEPGTIYVYRSYGIHWCMNIKCGMQGYGEGVLIRAIKPLFGLNYMARRRRIATRDAKALCNGPGKLTQAMGIDGKFDGQPISEEALFLFDSNDTPCSILSGKRIGIRRGLDLMWRFGWDRHPCLSRPFTQT